MTTAKKERKLDIVNVWVLTKYKNYLEDIMRKDGYATQGEALMGIMDDHEAMRKRIKQLEQQLKDAGLTPVDDAESGSKTE